MQNSVVLLLLGCYHITHWRNRILCFAVQELQYLAVPSRLCRLVGFMLLGVRIGQLDVGVNRQEVGIGLVVREQISA